uniref:Uncharacterized protein n=1 Tax=Cacopsylla melanoneura TaxID=428564 RepID=A0A8D9E9R0_9HEMI
MAKRSLRVRYYCYYVTVFYICIYFFTSALLAGTYFLCQRKMWGFPQLLLYIGTLLFAIHSVRTHYRLSIVYYCVIFSLWCIVEYRMCRGFVYLFEQKLPRRLGDTLK